MSSRITVMRLYTRVQEGVFPDSVVAFMKLPWAQEYLPETPSLDGLNYPTITQWRYGLSIDLWLIKIQFKWLGRDKSTKNTSDPMPRDVTKQEGE